MPRNVQQQPSPWFRRFMILTGIVIVVCTVMVFTALTQQNYSVAFPLLVGILVLLAFEVVLLMLHNRSRI